MRLSGTFLLLSLFFFANLCAASEYREYYNNDEVFVYIRADLIVDLDNMTIEEQDLVLQSLARKRARAILYAEIYSQSRTPAQALLASRINLFIDTVTEIDSIERDEYVEAYYKVTLKGFQRALESANEKKVNVSP